MIINREYEVREYDYYTVKNLLEDNNISVDNYITGTSTGTLKSLIETILGTTVANDAELFNDYTSTLINKYVLPLHINDWIVRDTAEIKSWIRLLLLKVRETYSKYKTMLTYFTTEETHLLDKMNWIKTNSFNNTPQVSTTPEADGYMTTFAKETINNDIEPVISRLNNIRENWDNLYRQWAWEFEELFAYTNMGD